MCFKSQLQVPFKGIFTWEESQNVASYTNWWPGEPNGGDGGLEDCVYKGKYQSSFGWNDFLCSMDHNYNNGAFYALCIQAH